MKTGPGLSRFIASTILLLAGMAAAISASAADTLDLAHYRGKVVLVDFWASWCTPCRRSFPWLNEMQRKYGERGLVVIGVNVDSTRGAAEEFLRDVPSQFQIIYDPSGALATQYQVPGMPSSFLFGPDGKLISNHIGFQQSARDEREAELQRLLSAALPAR
jgi:thiol-disulfide isomerase/thioredoxin